MPAARPCFAKRLECGASRRFRIARFEMLELRLHPGLCLCIGPYRAIVNWRRPGGPGWAGQSGQSSVVSLGPLYIIATHIVKGKNEAAGPGGPDHRTKAAGHEAAEVNRPAGLLSSIPANVLAPVSPAHDACPASSVSAWQRFNPKCNLRTSLSRGSRVSRTRCTTACKR